jgi:steroid 5-alpha reductase family enzyme
VFQADLTTAAGILVAANIFYGFRLAMYLAVRDLDGRIPRRDKEMFLTRFKRIPLALLLALFYACMTTLTLYALRVPPTKRIGKVIALSGALLAWVGAILQAIADGHKMVCKAKQADLKQFKGPDGGVYRICRHPNYLGEIIFWGAVYATSLPSFGKSIQAWIAASLGLYGIVQIMLGATNRLEKSQQEKYGGQSRYEAWKRAVSAPCIPFVTKSPGKSAM